MEVWEGGKNGDVEKQMEGNPKPGGLALEMRRKMCE